MINLHVLPRERLAAVRDAFCMNARENSVELVFAHLERIVMGCDAIAAGKIQSQRVIDSHWREITDCAFIERKPEDSREKLRRGDFVARGYDRVIELDSHTSSPDQPGSRRA